MYLAKDLSGDGRRKISPNPDFKVYIHGSGSSMRLGSARVIIFWFNKVGHSNHTGLASTIWVLEEYCYLNDIEFRIESQFHGEDVIGYSIIKTNNKENGGKNGTKRKER